MMIKPLHDRVAVELEEQETKTAGGIIIPDSAKEKPVKGTVVAVGSGTRDDKGNAISLDVKVGDKVIFGKWSGTEIEVSGKKLLIMKESDIMGILKN
jgi:chaperonin GroES